jgi:hypothetical protein
MSPNQQNEQKNQTVPMIWDFPPHLPSEPLSLLPSIKSLEFTLLWHELAHKPIKKPITKFRSLSNELDSLISYITAHQSLVMGYLAFLEHEQNHIPCFSDALSYKPFFETILSYSHSHRKKQPDKSTLEEIGIIHNWVKESLIQISYQIRGCHCWEAELSLIRSYRLSVSQLCPLYVSLSRLPDWAIPFDPFPSELSKRFLFELVKKAFERAEKIWIAGQEERQFLHHFNISPRQIRQAPRIIWYSNHEQDQKTLTSYQHLLMGNDLHLDTDQGKIRLIIDGPINADMDLYTLIYNLAEIDHLTKFHQAWFLGPLDQQAYWQHGMMIAESLGILERINYKPINPDLVPTDPTSEIGGDSIHDPLPGTKLPWVVFPSLVGVDFNSALHSIARGQIVIVPEIPKNQPLIEEFQVICYKPGHRRDMAQKILSLLSEPQKIIEKVTSNLSTLQKNNNDLLIEEYYKNYKEHITIS